MSRGGREPVELRQVFLARQYEFRGRQRIRQQAGLLGDTRFVDADEGDPEDDRAPGSDAEQEGEPHRLAGVPGKRQVPEDQQGRGDDRETTQKHGAGGRHRSRGDHHGRQQQHGERVFETPGQEQKRRELHEVIAEQQGRGLVGETMAHGIAPPHADVHGYRKRDDEEAPADREGEAQDESGEQDAKVCPVRASQRRRDNVLTRSRRAGRPRSMGVESGMAPLIQLQARGRDGGQTHSGL